MVANHSGCRHLFLFCHHHSPYGGGCVHVLVCVCVSVFYECNVVCIALAGLIKEKPTTTMRWWLPPSAAVLGGGVHLCVIGLLLGCLDMIGLES